MPDNLFLELYSNLESYDKGVAICAVLAFHLGLRVHSRCRSIYSVTQNMGEVSFIGSPDEGYIWDQRWSTYRLADIRY